MSDTQVELLSTPAHFDMAPEWYELAHKEHFWFRWRFRILRAALQGVSLGERILEIGSGNGVAVEQFEAWLGRPIDGCDLNLEALKLAPTGLGKHYFYDIHDRRAPWKGHFDTILLLDVLEHIPEPLPFLASVLYHVAPGGLVAVNVPAHPILYSAYDRIVGHHRRYTQAQLRAQMSEAGLEIVAVRPWGLTLLPILALRKFLLRRADPADITRRGFEPPNRWVDAWLKALMRLETAVDLRLPIGSSLVMVGRKPLGKP